MGARWALAGMLAFSMLLALLSGCTSGEGAQKAPSNFAPDNAAGQATAKGAPPAKIEQKSTSLGDFALAESQLPEGFALIDSFETPAKDVYDELGVGLQTSYYYEYHSAASGKWFFDAVFIYPESIVQKKMGERYAFLVQKQKEGRLPITSFETVPPDTVTYYSKQREGGYFHAEFLHGNALHLVEFYSACDAAGPQEKEIVNGLVQAIKAKGG